MDYIYYFDIYVKGDDGKDKKEKTFHTRHHQDSIDQAKQMAKVLNQNASKIVFTEVIHDSQQK